VFFSEKSRVPVTCGWVNSKNSLGGYTGKQAFIAAGSAGTFLQSDVKGFEKAWSQFCK
jgi:hypothetical protein